MNQCHANKCKKKEKEGHMWVPQKRDKRSELTLWLEVQEKEELNMIMMVRVLVVATSIHWPQTGPNTLYTHLSPLIFTTLWHTSYYYPHFRVKETEEQRDEVICANRTWVILTKTRHPGKRDLGRRMRSFLHRQSVSCLSGWSWALNFRFKCFTARG